MKILFIGLLLLVGTITLPYQSISQDLGIDNIPSELVKNAHAVVRYDNSTLEILNEGRAKYSRKYAITILNKNADNDACFRQYYNEFFKVQVKDAIIYDKYGSKVKKISKKDFKDFSAISGFSTYEDSRVVVLDPNFKSYPYTIEYEYNLTFKAMLKLPNYEPYSGYGISVQKSNMNVIVPLDIEFRYHENDLPFNKVETIEDKKSYSWKVNNLKAIKYEYFCDHFSNISPNVHFAINNFSIDGTTGDASSWKSFGKWVYDLNAGRDELPKETKEKIHYIIKGCKNNYDKINALYKFMQKNTRYVSVQVGIGGWQATKAEDVDRLGYGDCKALSNYMKAIFDVAGIESHYAIVNAGEDSKDINTDFPSNQFNHAFLCVPNGGDTLWLECTNQIGPCGNISSFTDNRHALIIKSDGGTLVRTQSRTKDENLLLTKAKVKIHTDGAAEVNFTRTNSGSFYDNSINLVTNDDVDVKKILYKTIDIPHFTIKEYEIGEFKNRKPLIEEKVKLSIDNYSTVMGKNLFFDVNLMNKLNSIPSSNKERVSDITIHRSFKMCDSITFILPNNCNLSKIPQPIEINTKFGIYKSQLEKNTDNNLLYVRTFHLHKGQHNRNEYENFIQFLEDIQTEDQKQMSLSAP